MIIVIVVVSIERSFPFSLFHARAVVVYNAPRSFVCFARFFCFPLKSRVVRARGPDRTRRDRLESLTSTILNAQQRGKQEIMTRFSFAVHRRPPIPGLLSKFPSFSAARGRGTSRRRNRFFAEPRETASR